MTNIHEIENIKDLKKDSKEIIYKDIISILNNTSEFQSNNLMFSYDGESESFYCKNKKQ